MGFAILPIRRLPVAGIEHREEIGKKIDQHGGDNTKAEENARGKTSASPLQCSCFFCFANLVEESPLGGGEAGDALLADLVEHPIDLRRHGIGVGAPARADRRGRRAALLGLRRAGLHHHHALDRAGGGCGLRRENACRRKNR